MFQILYEIYFFIILKYYLKYILYNVYCIIFFIITLHFICYLYIRLYIFY